LADAIFISYRRDDSEGEAGRLFSDLTRAFGADTVFMDVAGIKPGANFRKALEDNVSGCGVFLAIIGPTWATITNAQGVRRLDDPEDFVAMELSSALSRSIPVIPILVHEAKMPAKKDLPDTLKDFSEQQCVEISHTRWNSDVELLIQALKPYIAPPKLAVQPPVHATVPVQLPPPSPPAFRMPPPPPRKSKAPLIIGISAAVFLAFVVGVIVNQADKDPGKNSDRADQSVASAAGQTTEASPVVPSGAFTQPVPPPAKGKTQQNDDLEQAMAAISAPQHPGLAGSWKYSGPGYYTDNSLSRLVISTSGEATYMHAYGFCQPIECDWGTLPVHFIGASATASFRLPNLYTTQRLATVTVTPESGSLNVLIRNHFYQNAFNDNQASVVFISDE